MLQCHPHASICMMWGSLSKLCSKISFSVSEGAREHPFRKLRLLTYSGLSLESGHLILGKVKSKPMAPSAGPVWPVWPQMRSWERWLTATCDDVTCLLWVTIKLGNLDLATFHFPLSTLSSLTHTRNTCDTRQLSQIEWLALIQIDSWLAQYWKLN